MKIDPMQVVLFVIFWVAAFASGFGISFVTDDVVLIYPGGFIAGIVVSGIATLGYIYFIDKLPVSWQVSYYNHFKKSMIQRADRGTIHPFVDLMMKEYIIKQMDLDFKIGGMYNVKCQLQIFFEKVCESTEFAIIMAAEISGMGVPCVIISVPPKNPEA